MTGFTKSLKNKLLAVFIAVFALCAGAITVFAATGVYNGVFAEAGKSLTVTISEEAVRAGETAEVKISFKNNTGVASVNLEVFYDEELTLEKVEFNKNLGGSNTASDFVKNGSPVTLIWVNGFADFVGDDVFATLYFKLSETAENDCFCEIYAQFDANNIYDKDENPVNLTVESGGVTVTNAVAGDVNGDGVANNKDVTRLFQYLAKWSVTVNEATVDVNGDGVVNNKDVTRLFQYLAKWDVCAYITKFFKVTFDGNGGTLVSGEETQKVKENKSATAPEYEREGYEFSGFDKDFSCVTRRMTVTAQWKQIAPHEHTYSEEWSSDGAFHWHAATCGHTTEVSDQGPHEWNSTIDSEKKEKVSTCSVCGKVKTEKLVDYSEDYNKYSELGKTINLITASDFEVYSGAKSVFNSDYLYYKKLSVYDIGASDGVSSSTQSASDYLANIYSSVEAKISIGSRKDKNGKFMTNKLPSLSVGASSTYEKKRKTETSEYYYTYSFTYNGSERYIEGFRDINSLRSLVSYDLISDALRLRANQITPAQFVTYWGTHVITSAIYGQEINVDYSCITTSESNTESLKNKLDAEMEMRFAKTGVDASVGVDSSFLKTDSNSNTIQSLNINGRSKEKFGATSMEDFGKAYDSWREKNGGDVFIDVPEGSLYCVWDLLGEEYKDVKQLLDDYMYSECDKLSDEVLAKINSLKYEDDLKFDKDTQTLFLNLKYYQEHSDVGVDTFDRGNFEMKNGVLNVTPYYNGTPIKKIVIDGAYGQRNLKGQVIDFVVGNFALKFDKDFDEDLEIELNNVAFSAPSNTACFDFSNILNKNITVNINYNGKNYLEGGDGTAAKGVFNADGIDLGIIGSTGAELIVRGGAGADGASAGADGKNGATAIIAKNLTINTFGTLEVYGGNGGDGKAGSAGGNGGHSGNDGLDAEHGSRGGNGGNGGHSIVVEEFVVQNAKNVLLQGGEGRNGKDGGAGGRGGDGKGNRGARSGRGGNGGDGGNGGNGGSIIANDIIVYGGVQSSAIKIVISQSGAGGNGGAGGKAGTPAQNTGWGDWKGGLSNSGGDGGDGGKGGAANVLFINLIDGDKIICTVDLNVCYGKIGAGGKGGKQSDSSGDDNGDDDSWEPHDGANGIGYYSETAYNGHKYVLVSGKLTWKEAKEYAESVGGHLATITSAEENAVLKKMVQNAGCCGVWLGAENTSGSWKWVTGEDFSYTNWASDYPTGKEQRYLGYYVLPVVFGIVQVSWQDYVNEFILALGFIVEFE